MSTAAYCPKRSPGASAARYLFLAPLQLRLGYVELPGSGGCDIGARARSIFTIAASPVLGADVQYFEDGRTISLNLKAGAFRGALLYLDLPSHTGTENLMLAASMADGQTILENASVEPEVVDFGNFLNKMGADIRGLGSQYAIHKRGTKGCSAVEYTPMPDRLVAGTMMMACAIAGGDVTLRDVDPTAFAHSQRKTGADGRRYQRRQPFNTDSAAPDAGA